MRKLLELTGYEIVNVYGGYNKESGDGSAKNVRGTIEEQINGVFDNMEERLALVGLTLESVVQMEFAHKGGKDGLQFQVDAVAYLG